MNEKFVPFACVTHSAGDPRYEQWWSDHVKKTIPQGRVMVGNGIGHLFTITCSGKPIPGGKGSLKENLDFKLKAFADCAEADRKPAIEDPPSGSAKMGFNPHNENWRVPPPPGGLVLTTYKHWLHRDDNGQYGRVTNPVSKYRVTDFGQTWGHFFGNPAFAMHGVNWMWLSEQESKALVPADPKEGDTVEIPRALRLRLLLMHLSRSCESIWKSPEVIREDTLALRVEQVSDREVRLRLKGSVLLIEEATGKVPSWATLECPGVARWVVDNFKGTGGPQKDIPEKYQKLALDAGLEGVIVYDRQAKKFTRFDMVVLGETWGLTFGGLTYTRWPIGFTFELDMSDYEKGRSRGVPWRNLCTSRGYWNPDVLTPGYKAKEPAYVYPE